MITAKEVRKLMNISGSQREPFLFGVDFEMKQGFFVNQPLAQKEILWRVGEVSNFIPTSTKPKGTFQPHYMDEKSFADRFSVIHQGLMKGNSFLTNLTIKTPLTMDYALKDILLGCNSMYALLLPEQLVCFSPETFVKIDASGRISSNPMKGTISADVENAEEVILADPKESAEHYTVVDLIRSDLSRVATHVRVDRLRYIDRLKTSNGEILQVSSEIAGQLPDDYHKRLGDILFELLPAGSVSGAPKPATLQLIRDAEQEDRGFYCGIFGYYDGEKLDSAVAIRYIEKEGGEYFFRSGSGITINSQMRAEYEEDNKKVYLPFV